MPPRSLPQLSLSALPTDLRRAIALSLLIAAMLALGLADALSRVPFRRFALDLGAIVLAVLAIAEAVVRIGLASILTP